MMALSIRQPWAWLIAHGYKDVENRTWWTGYRGKFLIHAGKTMTRAEYMDCHDQVASWTPWFVPAYEELERGGIVGEAELVDCVRDSESPWFSGPYGFVVRNAKPREFQRCAGRLGFWTPELQQELQRRDRRERGETQSFFLR